MSQKNLIDALFKSNKLALNMTKTNYMVFTPNNKYVRTNLNIMIDGIYLAENLTWKYQFTQKIYKQNLTDQSMK